jgi:hypothetical protein
VEITDVFSVSSFYTCEKAVVWAEALMSSEKREVILTVDRLRQITFSIIQKMHLPQVHNNIFKNNFLTKYIIMNL